MKLIILSITKYKEKDAVITAISSEETLSFLARGILNPLSKSAFITTPMTIADVTFTEGNFKYPILKEASLLFSPLSFSNELENMALVMLLEEATRQMLQEEEKQYAFPLLEEILTSPDQKEDAYLLKSIYYLANVLKIAGYEFETSCCLFCGSKKNIRAFSFKDGGFVCKDCLNEDITSDLSSSQMRVIFSIFNAKSYAQLASLTYPKADMLTVYHQLEAFILDNFGFKLKAFDILK